MRITQFSNVSENVLFKTPIPAETMSYKPVAHKHIIDGIQERLYKNNLHIVKKQYRSARNNEKLIGIFDIEANNQDLQFRFGFKNSYDKSISLGIVAGTSVIICSNGMMSGEIVYMRKHTGTIVSDMNSKMDIVINQLTSTLNDHIIDMKLMRNIAMDNTERDKFLGKVFFRDKIISPNQATALITELEEPEFKEFSENNLWGMYNKMTHVLKREHPDKYIQKHIKLHELVKEDYL